MESNLVLLKIPENKLKLYWCRLCFKIFNDNPLYGISHDSCMFGTIQQINEVRCTCKYSSELFCFDIKILLKLTHSLQQVMESVTYFWRKIWILGNKTRLISVYRNYTYPWINFKRQWQYEEKNAKISVLLALFLKHERLLLVIKRCKK